MNEIQQRYAVAKAAYDAAFEAKDWPLVDQLEDEYLEAEARLIEWALYVAEKKGKMPKTEAETIRKNWTNPKFTDRVLALALSLRVAV